MASAETATLANEKRLLRRAMKDRRAQLPSDAKLRAAASAAEHLSALSEMRAAAQRGAVVAGFVAVGGEIDPVAALETARQRGAQIALPRVDAPVDVEVDVNVDDTAGLYSSATRAAGSPRMNFRISKPGDELLPGAFGIPEPDPSLPKIEPGRVAVMIVPGLAFDVRGRRLGYGGGYYDELLAVERGSRPTLVVGLGYDFQVVDACPADERDVRVDCVVTDARVIRCTAGSDSADADGMGRGMAR